MSASPTLIADVTGVGASNVVLSEEAVGLALVALGLTIFILAAALAVLALRLRLTRRELDREVRARRQLEAASDDGARTDGIRGDGPVSAEVAARLEEESARLDGRAATLEDRTGELAEDLAHVRAEAEQLKRLHRGTLCRVGLLRYDAFETMAGAHSFSAALLDASGDGLILSAVNGRTEGRMYAKPVVSGRSEHELTDEEQRAIDIAMNESPEIPSRRSRRRRGRASA
jgi:hypothetical protein